MYISKIHPSTASMSRQHPPAFFQTMISDLLGVLTSAVPLVVVLSAVLLVLSLVWLLLFSDPCAKCNLPVNQGGCKCDGSCNCLPGVIVIAAMHFQQPCCFRLSAQWRQIATE
jgi:hypothetical protein